MTRADTLYSLPAAFARIAAELRTQYALGYYPSTLPRMAAIVRSTSEQNEKTWRSARDPAIARRLVH